MDLLAAASTIKAQISDSMARQRAWGTNNAFINGDTGSDMRGMSEEQIADDLAEGMAMKITRQGGNY